MGILPAEAFAVRYTVHTLKGYTPFQMVFVRGMTLPIKNTVNWKLIRQHKQAQTKSISCLKGRSKRRPPCYVSKVELSPRRSLYTRS